MLCNKNKIYNRKNNKNNNNQNNKNKMKVFKH